MTSNEIAISNKRVRSAICNFRASQGSMEDVRFALKQRAALKTFFRCQEYGGYSIVESILSTNEYCTYEECSNAFSLCDIIDRLCVEIKILQSQRDIFRKESEALCRQIFKDHLKKVCDSPFHAHPPHVD